jgi:hypothetical protein
MPVQPDRQRALAALSSIWTVSRGGQVVRCELIVPPAGQPILRCGYGPHAVIRSQCIPSEDAAVAIAEIWKAALLEHGFRVESSRTESSRTES